MQDINAIDMAIHERVHSHLSVKLLVVVPAKVMCSFNSLIALEAKCHPSNGSNFIAHIITYTLHILMCIG